MITGSIKVCWEMLKWSELSLPSKWTVFREQLFILKDTTTSKEGRPICSKEFFAPCRRGGGG